MQTRTFRRGAPALIAVALAVTVAGCSGSDATEASGTPGSTTAAASTAAPSAGASEGPGGAASTAKPVAPSPGATGTPSVAISRAPVVKVGKIAKLSDNVQVYVGKVRSVKVKAEQPGEIAGDAAAVQLTVKNTAGKPFSLDGLVVTVSYGDDDRPGDQTTSGPSSPLTGSLAVGRKARGTYVFMVPRQEIATLHVEVTSDESPTIVRFAR